MSFVLPVVPQLRDSQNSAELLRNVTSETRKVVDGVMLPFMELALNLTMFVVILGALLIIEPLITVVTINFLGIGGGIFLKYTRKKTGSMDWKIGRPGK